jgi:hypothetical protein
MASCQSRDEQNREGDWGPQLSHLVFRPKLNAFLYVCQDQVSHIKR